MDKTKALRAIQEKAREHYIDTGQSFADWFFVFMACELALGQSQGANGSVKWALKKIQELENEGKI